MSADDLQPNCGRRIERGKKPAWPVTNRPPLRLRNRVEVLPFHQLEAAKWAELGVAYQLRDVGPPSTELVQRVENQFRSHGLHVV